MPCADNQRRQHRLRRGTPEKSQWTTYSTAPVRILKIENTRSTTELPLLILSQATAVVGCDQARMVSFYVPVQRMAWTSICSRCSAAYVTYNVLHTLVDRRLLEGTAELIA